MQEFNSFSDLAKFFATTSTGGDSVPAPVPPPAPAPMFIPADDCPALSAYRTAWAAAQAGDTPALHAAWTKFDAIARPRMQRQAVGMGLVLRMLGANNGPRRNTGGDGPNQDFLMNYKAYVNAHNATGRDKDAYDAADASLSRAFIQLVEYAAGIMSAVARRNYVPGMPPCRAAMDESARDYTIFGYLSGMAARLYREDRYGRNRFARKSGRKAVRLGQVDPADTAEPALDAFANAEAIGRVADAVERFARGSAWGRDGVKVWAVRVTGGDTKPVVAAATVSRSAVYRDHQAYLVGLGRFLAERFELEDTAIVGAGLTWAAARLAR